MATTAQELAAVRASGAKGCCKDPANLVRSQPRPDLAVNLCRVCGCNHYRVTVEPAVPPEGGHDGRQN